MVKSQTKISGAFVSEKYIFLGFLNNFFLRNLALNTPSPELSMRCSNKKFH